MFKNYRYWLFVVSKKVSTYIFTVLFLTFFSILITIKAQSNTTDNSVLWRLGFYYYFIPFLCALLFSVMKVLDIFKESVEGGIELTLVSKPFKRWQLIYSKFLALYSVFIFYAFITFVWLFLFALGDGPSTMAEKLRFAGSYSVGSLIIMLLTSSMIILLSQLLNTLMIISVVGIIALLPLATATVAPLTNAQHLKFVGTAHYMLNKDNVKTAHVKSEQMFFFNPSGITTSQTLDEGLYKRMKSEYAQHKKSPYKYIAYVDIYQQLSGFLSMFQDKQYSYESIANWTESTRTVHSDYTFNIDGWEYIYMYWNDSRKNNLTASHVYKISKQAARYVYAHKNEKKWQGYFNGDLLNRSESKEWKELVSSYLTSKENFFDENTLRLSTLIAEKENHNFYMQLKEPAKTQDLMYIRGILANGGEIPVYVPKPFIAKYLVILIWTVLSIAFSLIVVMIYSRKDFK